jgi:hypothetical protein
VLAVVGVAALVGLVIGFAVGPLGGSGVSRVSQPTTSANPSTPSTPTVAGDPVSVEFVTKKLVWVCLVDERGTAVIDGQNLLADQTVGPYAAKSFEVAFGNGAIDLTVNGEPVDVPPIAAPLGYRITPAGVTRLGPSEEPTCIKSP